MASSRSFVCTRHERFLESRVQFRFKDICWPLFGTCAVHVIDRVQVAHQKRCYGFPWRLRHTIDSQIVFQTTITWVWTLLRLVCFLIFMRLLLHHHSVTLCKKLSNQIYWAPQFCVNRMFVALTCYFCFALPIFLPDCILQRKVKSVCLVQRRRCSIFCNFSYFLNNNSWKLASSDLFVTKKGVWTIHGRRTMLTISASAFLIGDSL